MSKALILSLLMLSIAFSLEVAINSNDYRCMVVYSTSEEDHLKLNIKFRKLAVENNGYYEILLTNTETEATDRYTIEEGNFRKELQLTENVVYKVCIKIVGQSSRGHPVQEYMDYNAATAHASSIYQQHIEVPKNLLKIADLHKSYKQLVLFNYDMEDIKNSTKSIVVQADLAFRQQNQKIQKIELISFIELAAICILGAYQYYRLKNIIQTRHS